MTLASAIIQSAFREGNILPVGKSPTTDEQTEALERLNRYVKGVFGYEMGENFADWMVPAPQRTAPLAANYPQMPLPQDTLGSIMPLPYGNDPTSVIYRYPPANSRIVWGLRDETAFFPELPSDGARMSFACGSGAGDSGATGQVLTLDGNGRTIEGQDQLLITATTPTLPAPREWLYRADLAGWVAVTDMALTDQLPFPPDFDDLWIAALAIRLAPRYEKQVHPATVDCFKNMMTKLKARYRQAGTTQYNSGDMPRSLQSYISGRWWY